MDFVPKVAQWRGAVTQVVPCKSAVELVLAIIQRESGGDPDATGSVGEVGLMQVICREQATARGWPHPEQRPPEADLRGNPLEQIRWGWKILTSHPDLDTWSGLLAYATGKGGIASASEQARRGAAWVASAAMGAYGEDPWGFYQLGLSALDPSAIVRPSHYVGPIPRNGAVSSVKGYCGSTGTPPGVEQPGGVKGSSSALLWLLGGLLVVSLWKK